MILHQKVNVNGRRITYDEFHKKLLKKVVESQAFRNPNISQKMVADMLGVTPRLLTMLVRELEGCNFASFISKHRLKFSANLLLHREKLNIKEIAEESGYSNISTFQRSFRAIYGVSPGMYRQSDGITEDLLTRINKLNYKEFAHVLSQAYPKFSDRELKICHLCCQGKTPEEQAVALGTSKDTIEVTRSRLRKKLGLVRADNMDMKIIGLFRKHFAISDAQTVKG